LKDNNGFRYNLNEENIFGNLYYSMNQDFLKGKMANILLNDKYTNIREKLPRKNNYLQEYINDILNQMSIKYYLCVYV